MEWTKEQREQAITALDLRQRRDGEPISGWYPIGLLAVDLQLELTAALNENKRLRAASPPEAAGREDGPEVLREALRLACADAWPNQPQWEALYIKRAKRSAPPSGEQAVSEGVFTSWDYPPKDAPEGCVGVRHLADGRTEYLMSAGHSIAPYYLAYSSGEQSQPSGNQGEASESVWPCGACGKPMKRSEAGMHVSWRDDRACDNRCGWRTAAVNEGEKNATNVADDLGSVSDRDNVRDADDSLDSPEVAPAPQPAQTAPGSDDNLAQFCKSVIDGKIVPGDISPEGLRWLARAARSSPDRDEYPLAAPARQDASPEKDRFDQIDEDMWKETCERLQADNDSLRAQLATLPAQTAVGEGELPKPPELHGDDPDTCYCRGVLWDYYCKIRIVYREAIAQRDEARRANERDRSVVYIAITAVDKALNGFAWLRNSRGSYEWDDDRWHSEFTSATDAISGAAEPLRRMKNDLTNCPPTTKEANVIRDLTDRAVKAEAKLAALDVPKPEELIELLEYIPATMLDVDHNLAVRTWLNKRNHLLYRLRSLPSEPRDGNRKAAENGK